VRRILGVREITAVGSRENYKSMMAMIYDVLSIKCSFDGKGSGEG
jgi:hypothetical protein